MRCRFPAGPGWDFHDHWLALVAMALGEVAYVDRPLYDYVQHPGAVLGRAASKQERSPRARAGLRARLGQLCAASSAAGAPPTSASTCSASFTRGSCLPAAEPRSPRASDGRCGSSSLRPARRWPSPGSPPDPARALFGRNETLGIEAVLVEGDPLAPPDRAPHAGARATGAIGGRRQRALVRSRRALGPRQRRWLARR